MPQKISLSLEGHTIRLVSDRLSFHGRETDTVEDRTSHHARFQHERITIHRARGQPLVKFAPRERLRCAADDETYKY